MRKNNFPRTLTTVLSLTLIATLYALRRKGGDDAISDVTPYNYRHPDEMIIDKITWGNNGEITDSVVNFANIDPSSKETPEVQMLLRDLVEFGMFKPAALNVALAFEAYDYVGMALEEIMQSTFWKMSSQEEKMQLGRNLFCEKSDGYTTNFFHLLAIPLAQIDSEAEKYSLMLQKVRLFLDETGLSTHEVFEATADFNTSPLGYMAVLAPLNQFQQFCEIFGDIIPQQLWEKESYMFGVSPLGILTADQYDGQYRSFMACLIRSMGDSPDICSRSPSNILHRPGSSNRRYYIGEDVLRAPGWNPSHEHDGPLILAFPKHLYERNADGTYRLQERNSFAVNADRVLSFEKRVVTQLSQREFEEIEGFIPEGPSYGELLIQERREKLDVLKTLLKRPAASPSGTSTKKLNPSDKREL